MLKKHLAHYSSYLLGPLPVHSGLCEGRGWASPLGSQEAQDACTREPVNEETRHHFLSPHHTLKASLNSAFSQLCSELEREHSQLHVLIR